MIEDGNNTTIVLVTNIMEILEGPTMTMPVQDGEEDRLPLMEITLLTQNTTATDHRYRTCINITRRHST